MSNLEVKLAKDQSSKLDGLIRWKKQINVVPPEFRHCLDRKVTIEVRKERYAGQYAGEVGIEETLIDVVQHGTVVSRWISVNIEAGKEYEDLVVECVHALNETMRWTSIPGVIVDGYPGELSLAEQ
jgi:hypothetical protein